MPTENAPLGGCCIENSIHIDATQSQVTPRGDGGRNRDRGGTLTAGAALALGPLAACAGIVVLTAVSALSANRSFDLVKKRGEVIAAALDSLLETARRSTQRIPEIASTIAEICATKIN